jgi:uncharacterized coiled-coil protein SlyX
MHTIDELEARIGALEDTVKAKDARIPELHAEVDEARQLVHHQHRHCRRLDRGVRHDARQRRLVPLGERAALEKERDELQADYDRLSDLIRPQLDFWASRQKPEPGRPIAASVCTL